jgi:hypothetical protein
MLNTELEAKSWGKGPRGATAAMLFEHRRDRAAAGRE